MDKNLTHLVLILDKSGSMDSMLSDAIGGYNTFLREQKKLPGKVNFSLVLFDSNVEVVHDNVDIADVPELTDETYIPGGTTALLDALGITINKLGNTLKNTVEDERPANVIVGVLTDGEENSSREYRLEKIRDMISHQQSKYNWHFIFLAANQDAIAEASRMGMNTAHASNFAYTKDGMRNAYFTLSSTVMDLVDGSSPNSTPTISSTKTTS